MKKKSTTNSISRSKDIPASQAMLQEVRYELKASISAIDKKMSGRFDEIKSEIHSVKLLFEEQNVRNKYVLDGLQIFIEKFQNHDDRLTHLENKSGIHR
jgi:hypothetical protein